ncbi:MAG: aminotransferase class IV [Sulfuricurvum sp.]|nr:aminotransferase class IV [Sulfuricurvum sp.]
MLLETLRCENGELLHLSYHQSRLNKSLHTLEINKEYDLQSLISPPSTGVYRCRFLYDRSGYSVEFYPYEIKPINSIRLLSNNAIEYPLKYTDRGALDTMYNQRQMCDDVLIVKNGLLTDTTRANIALLIDNKWLTPDTPLLFGTTRERLIQKGFLHPTSLSVKDISKAKKIALLNAMIGFIEVENGIII